MSDFSINAQNCFEANLKLLDATENPVEWNLNNGLFHLALAITAVEKDLDALSLMEVHLEQAIDRLS
ncbi:MAG: hypothetical protein O3B76_08815 [Proteobacteria bacterium]|nr:hypothetical protein [Pseudomonadota bacterium]MDA1022723.1 hypothetical protein [Pseudomonadota bacterium]